MPGNRQERAFRVGPRPYPLRYMEDVEIAVWLPLPPAFRWAEQPEAEQLVEVLRDHYRGHVTTESALLLAEGLHLDNVLSDGMHLCFFQEVVYDPVADVLGLIRSSSSVHVRCHLAHCLRVSGSGQPPDPTWKSHERAAVVRWAAELSEWPKDFTTCKLLNYSDNRPADAMWLVNVASGYLPEAEPVLQAVPSVDDLAEQLGDVSNPQRDLGDTARTESTDLLVLAHDDLAAAVSLIRDGLYAGAGFHCQQALEKALKALTWHMGQKPLGDHDLIDKLKIISRQRGTVGDRLATRYRAALTALQPFAVDYRYKLPPEPLTREALLHHADMTFKVVTATWRVIQTHAISR